MEIIDCILSFILSLSCDIFSIVPSYFLESLKLDSATDGALIFVDSSISILATDLLGIYRVKVKSLIEELGYFFDDTDVLNRFDLEVIKPYKHEESV